MRPAVQGVALGRQELGLVRTGSKDHLLRLSRRVCQSAKEAQQVIHGLKSPYFAAQHNEPMTVISQDGWYRLYRMDAYGKWHWQVGFVDAGSQTLHTRRGKVVLLQPFCAWHLGGVLWVREPFLHKRLAGVAGSRVKVRYSPFPEGFEADRFDALDLASDLHLSAPARYSTPQWTLCPAAQMPFWASRFMLECREVRWCTLDEALTDPMALQLGFEGREAYAFALDARLGRGAFHHNRHRVVAVLRVSPVVEPLRLFLREAALQGLQEVVL